MPNSAKVDRLQRAFSRGLTPPPRLSVPAWADRFRKLAPEAGSTSGDWRTGKVEVARGPMLAVTEPGVHTITVMVCTQLLKSALLENVFGYHAHLDPCPMLLIRPKDEDAEAFSKERITPLLRVTPVLTKLVGTDKTRNAKETLAFKTFPGGFLAIVGAGSPANLASRPVRLILADEIDKYPVTREGDPIMLAEERTATFGLNWLSIRACSPTIEDESRIAESYYGSDQRRASVVCPHCGHRQFLDFFKHVHWEKRENAKGEVVEHLTKTARVHCEACGVAWSEGERLKALQTTRWHQTRPFECCDARHVPLDAYDKAWRSAGSIEDVWDWWDDPRDARWAVYRAKCPTCGTWGVDNAHAGFQAGKLFAPWAKDRPQDIAAKWVKAKGKPDAELAWWNTQMGLPHRPHVGKTLAVSALLARREVWAAEVPDRVVLGTHGIDVQDYRVEIEVVGWGADEESWSLAHHVIEGEFSEPSVQAAVDAYLKRPWRRADGSRVEMLATCIDSGGHHTQAVYAFSKARLGQRVWAIKGASESGGQRNPVWPVKRPSRKSKASFRPVMIGGNSARDTIRQRLYLDQPAPGAAAPGYMHFPIDRDIGYFEQLTADRLVLKEVGGRRFRVWETPAGRANEASDCRVYAYAAICGLVHFGLQLNKRARVLAVPAVVEPIEAPTEPLEPRAAASRRPPPPPPARCSLAARLA